MFLLPHIPVENMVVARTRRQDIPVPSHGANAAPVPGHRPQFAAARCIPNLDFAFVRPDREVRTALRPGNARDGVVRAKVTELRNLCLLVF